MEAIEFVTALRERIIERDHQAYQNLLDNTTEATDPLWKKILPLYKSMTNEQKVAFLQFLRLIQVNTLSHILGILDGSTALNENNEIFVLQTEQDEEIINGDLQDIFWEMEEI
jgi:hypothetical protein